MAIMQPPAARLILAPLLFAFTVAGGGCRSSRDGSAADPDRTGAGTLAEPIQLLSHDSGGFPLDDGAAVPREKSPPAERCDPNYEPCVPIDSDVDCAGGRGNGPSYVAGPVRVVGSDPYDLDRDGDGMGCEN